MNNNIYKNNNKFYFAIFEYSSRVDCGFREIAFTRNLKVREKVHGMHVIHKRRTGYNF